MKAALVVPTALSGKALKVVTRYFDSKSSGPCKPLLGKEYDDNQILEILNIAFVVIFIPVNIQKMKFVVLK